MKFKLPLLTRSWKHTPKSTTGLFSNTYLMDIRRTNWSQVWQQCALCPMLFALLTRQQRFELLHMSGVNICSWIEGHALNLDTIPMNSKRWYSPSQVIWVIWDVFSLRQVLNYHFMGQKSAHSYLWLESLLCGQTIPSQFSKAKGWLTGAWTDLVWRLLLSFPAWILR